jgi:serine/threonine-protein kinase RsbW
MPRTEPEVHLAIGSRFENIELVKVVLDDCLQRLDVGEDDRHWIDLAVREAVANAIKHGNRQDPAKQVTIEMSVHGGDVAITVADEGAGFDPEAVGDPLLPENRFRRDGRGIFYMKRFMDEVDYRFRPGEGTVVTLRKHVARPAAGANAIQEESS